MAHNKTRSENLSPRTMAVHAGREDFAQLGVHAPPIDLSTTYPLAGLEQAADSFDHLVAGGQPGHGQAVYSRLYNPTVGRFEKALARLEGAGESVAFASGMAALTAVLLAARRDGKDHVVAVRPLYGGSDHLLSSGLLGLRTTWAEAHEVATAIEPGTALVVVETPANPTLALVDIAVVVEQSGDVPVLVDSTFATPVLQRPLEQGATLVLHSATKFLGGHGDVLAGVVATSCDSWAAALRQVRIVTGAVLHPLGAYLLHRGLATLPVRVDVAQRGAQRLADCLVQHPSVSSVYYPGLSECDPRGLVGRQMSGPGTLISFEVAPATAARVIDRLELITVAVSLGSVDTLIQHPAAMTHRVVSNEARRAGGITPGLLRLSVGLEDPDDLWSDLQQALGASSSASRLRLPPHDNAANELLACV